MINLLPAVLIGGSSHTETSALFYSLSQALYKRRIPHSSLRICDVHGKIRQRESEQALYSLLSINDTWNSELFAGLGRELSQRSLPLLINLDVYQPDTYARIFEQCTHALLLSYEHNEANRDSWLQLSERYGLLPLAYTGPSITCNISGPMAQGIAIDSFLAQSFCDPLVYKSLCACFIAQITSLFSTYSHEELVSIQLHQAPGELVLQLSTLLHTLSPGSSTWEPQLLSKLLEYIPAHTSLSVYGTAPQWLYGALAAHAAEHEFYQLDPCFLPGEVHIGWVATPPLLLSTTVKPEIHTTYIRGNESGILTVKITCQSLYHLQATCFPFPPVPAQSGLILAGNIPTWLLTALVRLYISTDVTWIACQHHQQDAAVVVFSRNAEHIVGELVSTG